MSYGVVFVNVDGLFESDLEPIRRLNATNRTEAEVEALALSPPHGANFLKLIWEGQYQPPKIGFCL